MQFLKSYTKKVGKKDRDLKPAIHQVLTTDGVPTTSMRTSAITSVLKSPQPDATSLLSETQVYQPPTAVTPVPDYASAFIGRSSSSISIAKPIAETDHPSRTLMVMHAKASPVSEKEKDIKMVAAASYMYGPKVDEGYLAEKKPSYSQSDVPPRTNRAQALRQERNACRINEERLVREQLMKQRLMRAQSDTTAGSSEPSDDESEEAGEPIHARVIPKSLYHKPKITVRDTLSSKFRYLFNRKPAGVNVYFKQADDKNPKKKPPFVLASKQNCF